MANRREEERERLRQARQERESGQEKTDKRRLLFVYGGAGIVGLLVVAGIVGLVASSGGGTSGESHINQASGSTNGVKPDVRAGTAPAEVKVTSLKQAAKQAGCVVQLHLKDTGHKHIPPSAPTPNYDTSPPTSGPHVEAPYQQADGAYSEMPGEIFIVHTMEHGRVEFQYSPNLPEADQLALKGVYDTMYGGTLLFPNTNMTYQVAATAWTKLIGCKEYRGTITLDALRDFARTVWGKYGGESVTAFSLKGPTPLEPEV